MEFIFSNVFGDYCSLCSDLKLTRKYHGLFVLKNHINNQRYVLVQGVEVPHFFDKLSSNTEQKIKVNETNSNLLIQGDDFSLDLQFERLERKASLQIIHSDNNLRSLLLIANNRRTHDISRHHVNLHTEKLVQESDNIISYNIYYNIDNIKDPVIFNVVFSSDNELQASYLNLASSTYLKEEELRGYECIDVINKLIELKFKSNLKVELKVANNYDNSISNYLKDAIVVNSDKSKKLLTNTNLEKHLVRLYALLDYLYFDTKDKEFRLSAGFHWFDSWGRDTFIALPSFSRLLIKFGVINKSVIHSIFDSYLSRIKNGLIPNFISESPAYNSSDASLWLVNAFYEHYINFNDLDFISHRYHKIKDIVDGYLSSNDIVYYDPSDGLIFTKAQSTWMDAIVDNCPVTPREGKCIEINALFLNSLKIIYELGKNLGHGVEKYGEYYQKTRFSMQKFWNGQYLSDVIYEDNSRDDSFRPNQIIALSLPFINFDIFSKSQFVTVLSLIERELLTPVGLKTLSKSSSCYVATLNGNVKQKDKCYHNGAIWPWLLYPYYKVCKKLKKQPKIKFEEIFLENNQKAYLHVAEIFDPTYYFPDGCIAQLWSDCLLLDILFDQV
ncbi:MAG: hypothetical protein N3E37_00570 [Candidatus Micrarchaeota archaeon]|nr:hypothetical protein [Candidatus Micrarchaeota archaeon]